MLFLTTLPLFGQTLSVGVKAGVPLTDTFSNANQGSLFYDYDIGMRRYLVGGTAEVHLPFRLTMEVDAIYKRLGYNASSNSMGLLLISERTVANQWELPLLLKYEFRGIGPIRPFVDAGPSLRHLSGLHQTIPQVYLPDNSSTSSISDIPVELTARNSAGITAGGGITFKFPRLRISPELRYTHWGNTSSGGSYGRQGFHSYSD